MMNTIRSALAAGVGLGHFSHVQYPTAVVTAIEEFIDGTRDATDHATQSHLQLRLLPSSFAISEDRRDFDVEVRRIDR
jgi:hypothetical protein